MILYKNNNKNGLSIKSQNKLEAMFIKTYISDSLQKGTDDGDYWASVTMTPEIKKYLRYCAEYELL